MLACLLASALALPAFAQAEPLTYAEALRHADAAPSVVLAERTLELARRQLTVTAAPVRGELSTGYRWTWGERDLGAAGTTDLDDASFDAIALSLSFPVLGLGPSGDAIDRARADAARAEAEVAAARRAARIDVTNAFQRVLRAHGSRALAAAEVAYAVRQREALELSAAAG
ncbi:MAG: TolC family protein, partial [Trueperaceae bacterium]|nr:TolC family protein [Trueperaceae bacterium]